MSVGAICFTSSGSNGGCWVVLMFPRLFFFFWKKGFFSPYATYTKKKNCRRKRTRLTPKKKLRDLRQKKSDSGLFPQSSYAFLIILRYVRRGTHRPLQGSPAADCPAR